MIIFMITAFAARLPARRHFDKRDFCRAFRCCRYAHAYMLARLLLFRALLMLRARADVDARALRAAPCRC